MGTREIVVQNSSVASVRLERIVFTPLQLFEMGYLEVSMSASLSVETSTIRLLIAPLWPFQAGLTVCVHKLQNLAHKLKWRGSVLFVLLNFSDNSTFFVISYCCCFCFVFFSFPRISSRRLYNYTACSWCYHMPYKPSYLYVYSNVHCLWRILCVLIR